MSYRQLSLSALLGLLACRSGGPSSQSSPTAEASATEPGAAAPQPDGKAPPEAQDGRPRIERAETCAPEATTIEEAGVCLRLPSGYVAADPMPGLQIFEAESAPPITVRWQPSTGAFADTYGQAVGRLAELDASALTDSTRDGTGTFVYAEETQPQSHRVAHASSTVHVGTQIAWCSASAPVHAKLDRAFFEACQSMMASR